jgi:hypothetical protein
MKIDAKTQLFGEIGGLAAKIIDRTASPEKAKEVIDLLEQHKADVGALKKMTYKLAVTVTGHTETLGQIMQRLTKLDEFDGIKNTLDAIASEILISRRERTLRDKGFSDHQATLTDHELRLTRIELRGKQS